MDIRERKRQLRREMREAVAASYDSAAHRRAAEAKIVAELARLIAGSSIREPMGIWAFWPTLPEEPDFHGWLTETIARGTKVGLPRLNWADRRLIFRQVTDPQRDLEIDAGGLAQPRADLPEIGPDQVALILVPGLAFDRSGGRLGRGAGFYDRTLAHVPEHVRRVGICFDPQVIDEVPQDSWDRKVHAILSPGEGLRGCGDALARPAEPTGP